MRFILKTLVMVSYILLHAGTVEDEDFSYIRSLENVIESHDAVYENICQTILQVGCVSSACDVEHWI